MGDAGVKPELILGLNGASASSSDTRPGRTCVGMGWRHHEGPTAKIPCAAGSAAASHHVEGVGVHWQLLSQELVPA